MLQKTKISLPKCSQSYLAKQTKKKKKDKQYKQNEKKTG